MKRFFTAILAIALVISLCPTVFASDFFTDKEPVTDYAYSFVFVGDTQKVNYNNPENFSKIYDWIVNNVESKNIKHVFGLGDITDMNIAAEWERYREQISRLDGLVDYSVVRGNHDGASSLIYYSTDAYKESLDGTFDGTLLNSWKEFSVGDIKYISLCLDYGPSIEVLEWANEVVESHPNHNVIVTTHSYLEADGTITDENGYHPPMKDGRPTSGIDLWENFAKHHPNILMIVCGHISAPLVESSMVGEHGNIVKQFLIDPQGKDHIYRNQGGVGAVAIFYMSEDGRVVDIEHYSTIREAYYLEDCQISTTLETMDPNVRIVTAKADKNVINVAPGRSVDITYDITRNQGFGAMKLELSYDNSAMKLVGDAQGKASAGYTWSFGSDFAPAIGSVIPNVAELGGNNEDGIFLIEAESLTDDIMNKGEFITFHLEIPQNAPEGTYTFAVSADDASSLTTASNGRNIPCDVTFEAVTVNVGDVDDGMRVLGAQIRLPSENGSTVQGLRFLSSIEADIMAKLPEEDYPASASETGIGFGTVVLPTQILGENELRKDTVINYNGRDFAAKIVPAVKLYAQSRYETVFTAVMTNIAESNYTTEYTVVPYITYTGDNGQEITLYGESYGTSVFDIAVAAYNDENTDEYVKEYLVEEILSKVDPESYPADGGWSDIYRP